MEKVWEIKDPDEYLKPRKTRSRETQAPRIEKNPAHAYSLSLLFWGAGQSYNEEHGKALAFQVLLIGLIVLTVLAAIFSERILPFLQAHQISRSSAFVFTEFLFFGVLLFWISNAADAYRRAARSRTSRFPGVQNRAYPCLCSLLLPGWGQFLNGQPVKGTFFSAVPLFGFFALVTIPVTLLIWPFLEPSDTRFMIEEVFSLSVLYAPVVPFLWMLSSYDALKVSLDELKKEPLLERIKAANNRRRTQGMVQGVFPQVQYTLLLILTFIALSLIISSIFPAGFYSEILTAASGWLRQQGMIILPEIIDRTLPWIRNLSQ